MVVHRYKGVRRYINPQSFGKFLTESITQAETLIGESERLVEENEPFLAIEGFEIVN